MFRVGDYATIWACEDKGNYSVVEMSTSRKDKDSGEYITNFSKKFVRFIGEAHNKAKKYGLSRMSRIKFEDCGVESNKGKNGVWYDNFLVMDFSLAENNKKNTVDDSYEGNYDEDDELPV